MIIYVIELTLRSIRTTVLYVVCTSSQYTEWQYTVGVQCTHLAVAQYRTTLAPAFQWVTVMQAIINFFDFQFFTALPLLALYVRYYAKSLPIKTQKKRLESLSTIDGRIIYSSRIMLSLWWLWSTKIKVQAKHKLEW